MLPESMPTGQGQSGGRMQTGPRGGAFSARPGTHATGPERAVAGVLRLSGQRRTADAPDRSRRAFLR